jgi:hypothetical protein
MPAFPFRRPRGDAIYLSGEVLLDPETSTFGNPGDLYVSTEQNRLVRRRSEEYRYVEADLHKTIMQVADGGDVILVPAFQVPSSFSGTAGQWALRWDGEDVYLLYGPKADSTSAGAWGTPLEVQRIVSESDLQTLDDGDYFLPAVGVIQSGERTYAQNVVYGPVSLVPAPVWGAQERYIVDLDSRVPVSDIGAPDGVAGLDADGFIFTTQLPDDLLLRPVTADTAEQMEEVRTSRSGGTFLVRTDLGRSFILNGYWSTLHSGVVNTTWQSLDDLPEWLLSGEYDGWWVYLDEDGTLGTIEDGAFVEIAEPYTLLRFETELEFMQSGHRPLTDDVLWIDGESSVVRRYTTAWVEVLAEGTVQSVNGVGGDVALAPADAWFGAGTDGALVFDGEQPVAGAELIAGAYQLTRDIAATGIEVAEGVSVAAAGYRIYCKNTIVNDGEIHDNGGDASGVTAGARAAAHTVGTSSTDAPSVGGSGGAGGAGTDASGVAGGTVEPGRRHLDNAAGVYAGVLVDAGQPACLTGGANGGEGGGNGTSPGGGGGGGGGIVWIAARSIAGTGVISANGGAGGSGPADCGGGGGGGGGAVIVFTAGPVEATLTVTGGPGGAASGGGVAGSAGLAGTVRTYDLTPVAAPADN